MVRLLWYLTPPAPVMWQEILQLEVDEAWEFSLPTWRECHKTLKVMLPRYPLT